jgi:hypothetical protein
MKLPKLALAVLQEVAAARGRNECRGRCFAVENGKEIWVEVAARGSQKQGSYLVIHGLEQGQDCHYSWEGGVYYLRYAESMRHFIADAMEKARGGKPYLRTHLNKTEYK